MEENPLAKQSEKLNIAAYCHSTLKIASLGGNPEAARVYITIAEFQWENLKWDHKSDKTNLGP